MPYLLQLVSRLAEGCGRMEPEWRRRWATATLAFQTPSGGFRGRSMEPDLYYTAFAVRTLSVIDGWTEESAGQAQSYLTASLSDRTSLIDLVSLLYAGYTLEAATGRDVFAGADDHWVDRLLEELERHRCDDGGYARTTRGAAGSTYQTFLNLLCYELLDRPVPQPERLIEFLLSQRADDGGFLEIRAAKRAGTNPTAAAIGALELLNALDEETRRQTVEFLLELNGEEGGFRANTRIPVCDLLSTFTGLWTLDRLGAAQEVDLERLGAFVDSLQIDAGYLGAVLDQEADVEYSFYGIGSKALQALLAE